ncbi:MAG: N-formylglutamate amidohydrolase [Sulfurimonas sp.]|nr:N-formylglutamate amidohydrolase [Sulfurimonas sp.]
MKDHYLLHIPHSGLEIPNKYLDDYLISADDLKQNIYQYADLFTDDLFDGLYKKFGGVKNSYSRLLFDPERFFDDKEESMHQQFKLGWFYENSILDERPLRDTKHKTEIAKYYREHHQKLHAMTKEKLEKHGKCTLIDCHSFSNETYWFLEDKSRLPDICIGFEEYHKDQQLIDIIVDEFKSYDIAINEPYSGSLCSHACTWPPVRMNTWPVEKVKNILALL